MRKNNKRLKNNSRSNQIITPELITQLNSFFEFVPPNEFRDNLIELYHQYIFHQHECLPHKFKRFSESMIIFIDFLKAAEEERKGQVLLE